MQVKKIRDAISEAERFLSRAKSIDLSPFEKGNFGYVSASKETAAIRRASLDLSRSLAEMRKT